MKDSLKKIKLRTFGYSIDSLKEDTFKKIRKGGELKQVLATLEDFLSFNDELSDEEKIPLEINCVVQQDNAYEIPSILEFIRGKGIKPYLIFLNYPLDFSLLNWPLEKQKDVLKFYLEDFEQSKDPELFKIAMDLLRKLPKPSQAEVLSSAGSSFISNFNQKK